MRIAYVSIGGALLALAAGFAGGCRKQPDGNVAEKSNLSTAPAPLPVALVSTVKPVRKAIARTTVQPGQVEAFEQARLYAKVAGYVQRINVDIGDVVQGPKLDAAGEVTDKGQVLAELSIPELDEELAQKKALVAQADADVKQSQAAVKVAQSGVVTAEALLKLAIASVDRAEADFQRYSSEYDRVVELAAKSAVTKKLVDETKNQMQAADAARRETAAKIESARAAISAAKSQVEKAMADEVAVRAKRDVAAADQARTEALLEYLQIRAPFDGTVTQRGFDVGSFAQAGGGNQGQPLFTVVRIDRVRVFVEIPEMDAPIADVGDEAMIQVQVLPGREFPGKIIRTSWALDSSSRHLRAEIDVPNSNGELRPGMYVQSMVKLDERLDALTLPVTAILTAKDGQTSCFVVEQGKAAKKPLVLGLKNASEVEVVSGLSGDEQVVQAKVTSLSDGQPLEIVPAGAGK